MSQGASPSQTRPEPAGRRWWHRLNGPQRAGLVVAEFAGIAILWQVAVGWLELVNPLFLPPPSRIATDMVGLVMSGELWPHLGRSVYEWTVGYVAAAFVGASIGFLLGGWVPFGKLAGPIIWMIYAAPFVAFQPLFTVWFGYSATAVIVLVFIATVFSIIFNTAAGVRTVADNLVRCSGVFGGGVLATHRKVILPGTAPFILVGLRQGAILATLGLLVGEILGASKGLGALMALKTTQFQVGATFALLVISMVLTSSFAQSLLWAGKHVAPWHFHAERLGS